MTNLNGKTVTQRIIGAACAKCGREADIPADGPGRVETITACPEGGTCVFVVKPTGSASDTANNTGTRGI